MTATTDQKWIRRLSDEHLAGMIHRLERLLVDEKMEPEHYEACGTLVGLLRDERDWRASK